MKKILEERSKMFSHDVCVVEWMIILMMGWKIYKKLETHHVCRNV